MSGIRPERRATVRRAGLKWSDRHLLGGSHYRGRQKKHSRRARVLAWIEWIGNRFGRKSRA